MNVGFGIGCYLSSNLVRSNELKLLMARPALGIPVAFLSLTIPPVLGIFIGIGAAGCLEEKLFRQG